MVDIQYSRAIGLLISIFSTLCSLAQTQKGTVSGHIISHEPLHSPLTIVINSTDSGHTDKDGYFLIANIPYGKSNLEVYQHGTRRYKRGITIDKPLVEVRMVLNEEAIVEFDEVVINQKANVNGLTRLGAVRETAIFEAKKSEVLVMKNIDANTAVNNARQVFAKVAGTNIWENDGSGIQLNVSSRGLSPNRSWEYNMRQNSYDIAADILGYPDMYYSPPMDAISHIEVVKGSASLQYGTQMGGLLNFILKGPSKSKPLALEAKQSVGSYGMFSSYTSVGGTKGKWSYFGYFVHRNAKGWRENSDYRWNSGFASVGYQVSEKLKISAEYTRMDYLLHLSAGLTDSMYKVDAQRSVRERNWFNVHWNIPSVKLDYRISPATRLTVVSYALLSSRHSIENTKPVNIIADTGYRDIRNDHYRNFGTEARFLGEYNMGEKANGIFAGGVRIYSGRTLRGQGKGTNDVDADFSFLHPDNLEYSDYAFRNFNVALFAENVFKLGKFSIVPGIRYEYINFYADGYFNSTAGVRTEERGISSKRRFPLVGLGLEYKLNHTINLYGNYTQGYRSANFNDIRITSPNIQIDPNLKDSRGHNVDVGIRGDHKSWLTFDVNAFYLSYNDRIGLVTRTNPDGSTYLLSTNIADSRNTGIESFAEVDFVKAFRPKAKSSLALYTSYAYTDARYLRSDHDVLKDKKVETAPNHILRTGLTYKLSGFSTTMSYAYVSEQYSDANNTVFTTNGSNGLVPSHSVIDWTAKMAFGNYRVGLTVNNVFSNTYFTRRATSYPGPGLIPAEPRVFVLTGEVKL